ncbi:hypothetical protein GCM10009809_15190 [Isoptericola hypogeus]|uniref:Uncharacterized protein n=1 Tax=Isoptericola hypogeus TaxID=300179 RepID=A0ABP4V9D8_9MICO
MPGPRALRDRRDRVPRLDADERHALVVVEHREEAGHAQLVRDGGQLGERLGLQVVGDPGGERRHPRAEHDAAVRVPHDEAVVLEGAQEPVRDRAVDAQACGDVVDGGSLAGVGEDLEDLNAAAERLGRGRCASRFGHRRPPGPSVERHGVPG